MSSMQFNDVNGMTVNDDDVVEVRILKTPLSSVQFNDVTVKYDSTMKIAVVQISRPKLSKRIALKLIGPDQCETLDKIIVVRNGQFFYIKNRCGPTGEFTPSQEEQDLIFEVLLQGE